MGRGRESESKNASFTLYLLGPVSQYIALKRNVSGYRIIM